MPVQKSLEPYWMHRVYECIADSDTFNTAVNHLKELYIKPPNEVFARHLLATCGQKEEENIDEYVQMCHYVGGPPSRRFLCLFWSKTRQRVWTRNLNATGSRKGTRVRELEEETQRRQLATGDAEGQSTPDIWETSRMRQSPAAVREDRSRWVGIPSSFVEISLEIHASVSLHMHKGMHSVTESPFLHFS